MTSKSSLKGRNRSVATWIHTEINFVFESVYKMKTSALAQQIEIHFETTKHWGYRAIHFNFDGRNNKKLNKFVLVQNQYNNISGLSNV